jgi:glycosyltransferase involved in cell wall biosynthesis
MKVPDVLHLSTYESFGGAARASKRIYDALKVQPIRCHMFTILKTSEDEDILVVLPQDPYARLNYIHRLLKSNQQQKLDKNLILESHGEISVGIVDKINAHQANIVHLHWINNLLSIEDIGNISKPIIWTLHDMWPFSGVEHFCYDPDAFFYDDSKKVTTVINKSYKALISKQQYWQKQKFTLVAPSHWLADCARRSILFSKSDIRVIPCLIDYKFWSPKNPMNSRIRFNFEINKKQILFLGKNLIIDPNKGWDLLQEVLSILLNISEIEFELVVVGHTGELVVDCPYKIHSLGEISDDEIIVELYSAVDLLVVPSRFEAFSQVTLEAQSCGLPVVGFDVGGIPDILIQKKTGWISPAFDLIDFSEGINWILKEEGRAEELGSEGRKNVIEKFSAECVSQQYFDLYQKVLSSN